MKTPHSLSILKLSRKTYVIYRNVAVRQYKQAIKEKLADHIRLSLYTNMSTNQKIVDDLDFAIKKLTPKNKTKKTK